MLGDIPDLETAQTLFKNHISNVDLLAISEMIGMLKKTNKKPHEAHYTETYQLNRDNG